MLRAFKFNSAESFTVCRVCTVSISSAATTEIEKKKTSMSLRGNQTSLGQCDQLLVKKIDAMLPFKNSPEQSHSAKTK